jgi:hypothetical protein
MILDRENSIYNARVEVGGITHISFIMAFYKTSATLGSNRLMNTI